MIKVLRKKTSFKLDKIQTDMIRSRSFVEKSNISMRGEYVRHKASITLPRVRFLERKAWEKENGT
jgi:hypothetical protein